MTVGMICVALIALGLGQVSHRDEHNSNMYVQSLWVPDMVNACSEAFPEEKARFEEALDAWKKSNHDLIIEGQTFTYKMAGAEGDPDPEETARLKVGEFAIEVRKTMATKTVEEKLAGCDGLVRMLESDT